MDTKYTQRLLLFGLLSVIISACSGILYSSLEEDDIRATAYDIATTSLATTLEVTINSPSSDEIFQAEATSDPLYCPKEDLHIWKDFAMIELKEIFSHYHVVTDRQADLTDLEELLPVFASRKFEVKQIPLPNCAKKSNLKIIGIYDEMIDLTEATIEQNPATMPYEKRQLLQSIYQFRKQVRELFVDQHFLPFDEIIKENFQSGE